MNTDWAAEQLQTIRTLMERSALYRRALAPVMTLTGCLALLAGVAGWAWRLSDPRHFVGYWLGVALATLMLAMILIRRQAFKAAEPFWSPPMRRVAQAMALPGCAALLMSCAFLLAGPDSETTDSMVILWLMFYGFALNAAGFFVRRGIRLFGWLMTLCGAGLGFFYLFAEPDLGARLHLVMGGLFGGPHLAYGIYLYFTEKPLETP
jgi:hypothetical protein